MALSYIRSVQERKPVDMILCVPNQGAIPGLLDTDVVEISCRIQDGAVIPQRVEQPGEIPMELIRRVKSYERYASKAIREKDKKAAAQCLFLHPLVNSWSLAQELTEEYIQSNKDYIEGWS